MNFDGQALDSIVVTKNASGRLVTADDGKEVIAIIAENKIVVMDGYDVKLVPTSI